MFINSDSNQVLPPADKVPAEPELLGAFPPAVPTKGLQPVALPPT